MTQAISNWSEVDTAKAVALPPPVGGGLYRVAQIAEIMGVSRGLVAEWIASGELPGVSVSGPKTRNKRWRVTAESLRGFIAARTTRPRRRPGRRINYGKIPEIVK